MEPYYQDDFATLYHGDALDVLPALSADVLITDPPFGVGFKGKWTKHTLPGGGYASGEDDADAILASLVEHRDDVLDVLGMEQVGHLYDDGAFLTVPLRSDSHPRPVYAFRPKEQP